MVIVSSLTLFLITIRALKTGKFRVSKTNLFFNNRLNLKESSRIITKWNETHHTKWFTTPTKNLALMRFPRKCSKERPGKSELDYFWWTEAEINWQFGYNFISASALGFKGLETGVVWRYKEIKLKSNWVESFVQSAKPHWENSRDKKRQWVSYEVTRRSFLIPKIIIKTPPKI